MIGFPTDIWTRSLNNGNVWLALTVQHECLFLQLSDDVFTWKLMNYSDEWWSSLNTALPVALLFIILYYYMRNFCNLIGLEHWYFNIILNVRTCENNISVSMVTKIMK